MNDRADLLWKRASAQRAETALLKCRLDAHVLRGATSEEIPPRYLRDVLRFTARIAWLSLRAWTNSLRAGAAAHRAELAALVAREAEHAERVGAAVLNSDDRARRAGLGPQTRVLQPHQRAHLRAVTDKRVRRVILSPFAKPRSAPVTETASPYRAKTHAGALLALLLVGCSTGTQTPVEVTVHQIVTEDKDAWGCIGTNHITIVRTDDGRVARWCGIWGREGDRIRAVLVEGHWDPVQNGLRRQ